MRMAACEVFILNGTFWNTINKIDANFCRMVVFTELSPVYTISSDLDFILNGIKHFGTESIILCVFLPDQINFFNDCCCCCSCVQIAFFVVVCQTRKRGF